jgi:NADH-quinone oxidoreductase subunit G
MIQNGRTGIPACLTAGSKATAGRWVPVLPLKDFPWLISSNHDQRQADQKRPRMVIEAAKRNGIEIPSFCYYRARTASRLRMSGRSGKSAEADGGLRFPWPRAWWCARKPSKCARRASTRSISADQSSARLPGVRQRRRVQLQDMVFATARARAASPDRKFRRRKQWSPVVFYDGPRCILCFRCVRICGEGMGVSALGWSTAAPFRIAPNHGVLNETSAACASISARWARSPAARIEYKT